MWSSILCIFNNAILVIMKARNIQANSDNINETTTIKHLELIPDMPELQSGFSKEMKGLDYKVFCKFQANSHNCFEDNAAIPEYYYDIKMGDCMVFPYGGCRETKNVFHRLRDCQRECRESGPAAIDHFFSPSVFCRFQPDVGTCADYIPMFYFDLSTHKCVSFAFTGCGGNQNRFKNSQDCSRTCRPAVSYQHFHPYDKLKH